MLCLRRCASSEYPPRRVHFREQLLLLLQLKTLHETHLQRKHTKSTVVARCPFQPQRQIAWRANRSPFRNPRRNLLTDTSTHARAPLSLSRASPYRSPRGPYTRPSSIFLNAHLQEDDELIFFRGVTALPNRGVEVVAPPFTALLRRPPVHERRHLYLFWWRIDHSRRSAEVSGRPRFRGGGVSHQARKKTTTTLLGQGPNRQAL